MFLKPFRIKTQTQLKASEKKKLYVEILQSFPSLSEDELSTVIPNKADVTLSKLFCNKGDTAYVYQIQKEPLFFKQDNDTIYPTVYFLWHFPTILKTFTTQAPVIGRLQQGADLMLPGIEVEQPVTMKTYGKFEKGTVVAINTSDNACPVALGKTALSSMDMYMAARQGKGVIITHIYKDYLWEMGSKAALPLLSNQDTLCSVASVANEGTAESPDECIDTQLEELSLTEDLTTQPDPECENKAEVSGPEAMDKLFLYCFLKACKVSAKKIETPILTSNFYRLHMVPICPDNSNLDIKKSSYKKLSKFLNEMSKIKLAEVKEFPKGVENITAINYGHDMLRSFVVDLTETTAPSELNTDSSNESFIPPVLEELYQVSGTTIDFFRRNGLGKGDVLSKADIKEVVTSYIEKNNLKKENKVELDPLLHSAVVNPKEGYLEKLRWDEVFSRFLGKMSPAYRILRAGEAPITRKGKLECIEFEIAKRSGNKKVTLVYNAGVFGIDEREFAHQIQVGVATSTSVGPAENKPQGTTQVLVQGNHVAFIGKLLLETYKIPRKYIKGLELAQRKKK